MLARIEPKFADLTLVIDGERDWLGPTRFADEYPEIGQGKDSVTLPVSQFIVNRLDGGFGDIGQTYEKEARAKIQVRWERMEHRRFDLWILTATSPPLSLMGRTSGVEKEIVAFCALRRLRHEPQPDAA